ncbi:unnamed protein product [Mytilus coruscus]|uniref:Fibrinogen C-terminal domain-containing protein n=1 Tax=Mytilus coruscus TaxID=42192 RepID=A0A6J8C9U4_MYTCO|nr:unnamed protein product [Mytilus coruscus]
MHASRHQQTKFVFLLLIFNASFYDSICTTVRVGKYTLVKDRRVKQYISPVISELAETRIVCVQKFHDRQDACLADYDVGTRTCNIFTSGCCPYNDELAAGFSLFRRNLTGFITPPAEDYSFYKNAGKPTGEDGSTGMMFNNDAQFKTNDHDDTARPNSPPCSQTFHSGWWFQEDCSTVNLNGKWTTQCRIDSIIWMTWQTYGFQSLERTSMKIRCK